MSIITGLKTYRIVATLHSKYGVDPQSDQGIEAFEFLTQRNPSQGIIELAASHEGFDPQDWDIVDWYSSEYQGKVNINAIRQFSPKEFQSIFFNDGEVT